MKKINYVFIGECVIIICLLVVIGILLRPEESENHVYKVEATSSLDSANVNVDGGESLSFPEKEEKVNKSELPVIVETKEATKDMDIKDADVIESKDKTQIVVFGDSIWNTDENGNGIAEYIMEEKDVIIYNCSIGGTTAAVCNESVQWDQWTSNSFNGMMYIANDIISEDELIPGEKACEVFKEIDFTQVDYIIVSYGLNDYFSDVPIHPREYYDLTSFVGALRHGVRKLQKKYPQAEIILTSPTYTEWFKGERQFGLGDYVEAARGVSAEYETHFLDMYHALGKNPDEKLQYLEDGVHLSSEGMALYARMVIDFLNNQGI